MAKFKFRLDLRIPEEAALSKRLEALPPDRHAEYMRSLALRGFRQECISATEHKKSTTCRSAESKDKAVTAGQERAPVLMPEPTVAASKFSLSPLVAEPQSSDRMPGLSDPIQLSALKNVVG